MIPHWYFLYPAFQAFLVTAIVAGVAVVLRLPLSYMYDHFLQFAVASALLSLALSIFLYIKSLAASESALAPGGNSGTVHRPFLKP